MALWFSTVSQTPANYFKIVKSAIFVGSKCHGFQKIKNQKTIVTT